MQDLPSEYMIRNCDECCDRLPLGWTLSPAYPGRLGAAGSVLIPASSITKRKVVSELSGWVESERKLNLARGAKITPLGWAGSLLDDSLMIQQYHK